MHWLVNRSVERFVRDTYGRETWVEVARLLDPDIGAFDAMQGFDASVTHHLMAVVAKILERPARAIEEDIGTYLVTHPHNAPVRRLLRFGGDSFEDFLHSLEDLPDRAHLALPGLDLPRLEVIACRGSVFTLAVTPTGPDSVCFGSAFMGLLRAMADDYGALVTLEHKGQDGARELIEVELLAQDHGEARAFALGAGAGQ
mgnify:CR=1 FL=1